jgi:biotin carboxyl carrier protein
MKIRIEERDFEVAVKGEIVDVDGAEFAASVAETPPIVTVTVNGRPFKALLRRLEGTTATINVDGKVYEVEVEGLGRQPARAAAPAVPHARHQHTGAGSVTALMPGRVVRINVQVGDAVEVGDVLLILEAMKMENEIRSPKAGVVKEIPVAIGQSVVGGQALAVIED